MCLFLSDDDNGVGCNDPADFDDDGDDFGGVDEGLDLGSAEVLEPMGKNWAKICSFYHSIYRTRNGTKQQTQFSYVFRIQISP